MKYKNKAIKLRYIKIYLYFALILLCISAGTLMTIKNSNSEKQRELEVIEDSINKIEEEISRLNVQLIHLSRAENINAIAKSQEKLTFASQEQIYSFALEDESKRDTVCNLLGE